MMNPLSRIACRQTASNFNFKYLIALLLLMFPAMSSSTEAQTIIPTNALPACTVPTSMIDGWFETGSLSLNGVVKPADSVNFSDIPNCDFYRWSHQMFLWATSPAPAAYGGKGRVFDSPVFFDVTPLDFTNRRKLIPHAPGNFQVFAVRSSPLSQHKLQIVLDKFGRPFEVEDPKLSIKGNPMILNNIGKRVEIDKTIFSAHGKPIFLDKAGKMIEKAKPDISATLDKSMTLQRFVIDGKSIFLNSAGNVVDVEQGQARRGQALMSQNNSLVYYAITVNDVYAYFLTRTKNARIPVENAFFPTTQRELGEIEEYAAQHGRTIIDGEALAIELKSSWVEASSVPDPQNYITTTATVPIYDQSDPTEWTQTGQRTIRLAMVGMHVVGSAAGHPEMIWTTFEHFGNTPNADYMYNSTAGLVRAQSSTKGSWLFSESGINGDDLRLFNQAHMSSAVPRLIATPGFTISPSNTLRIKPWGANPSNAASNTEIISINNDVLSKLIAGDARKNYFMVGSTWTIGGEDPNFGNQVGTNQLANSTMETYSQGQNCFQCHTSNTVTVSSIYPEIRPLFSDATRMLKPKLVNPGKKSGGD